VDETNEDVENEADPSFDKRTLGTGHFSHILLTQRPSLCVDVHTKTQPPPPDGFEATLWDVHQSARNQLFDLNHFGQVFWIHEGADHSHYCLTSHPNSQHQIVSLPCVHDIDARGELVSSPAAHAQLWRYDTASGELRHLYADMCLEHRPESVVSGSTLHLSHCAPHHSNPAQQWSWDSGAMAEHNPAIFDEHMARVQQRLSGAHGEAAAEHPAHEQPHDQSFHEQGAHEQAPTEHGDSGHMPPVFNPDGTPIVHEYGAPVGTRIEDAAAYGQLAQASAAAWQHQQLVSAEHKEYETEEAHLQALEAQVEHLAQQEAAAQAQLSQEHQELEHERAQEQHQAAVIAHDEARIAELEHKVAEGYAGAASSHHGQDAHDQYAGEQTHEGEEAHHESEEHHWTAHEEAPHRPVAIHGPNDIPAPSSALLQVPPEEPVHFFTPVTLLLAVAFVAILAYSFRVWLWPIFVKRYSDKAQERYSLYSHAY